MLSNKARGFTLIELVIIIVIMAVLAAVAGPRLFSSTELNTRLTQDAVISQIRGQQQAIMAGQTCRLQISDTQSQLLGDCFQEPYDFNGTTVELLNSNEFTLTFNEDGVPQGACTGGCELTIQQTDAPTQTICIESQGYAHGC
ncbi:MAG: prepilin-type N-terminal cleavage/methylation domain-containing protein [Ferrimonas sp.]